MIDVTNEQLLIIKGILSKHINDTGVRVFGSRITGKAKKYSDLDLVVFGKTVIDPGIIAKIKEDFEESDLPFRVDILDWNRISEEFKNIINQQYEVL